METHIPVLFQNAGKPRWRIPLKLGEPPGSDCSAIARIRGQHTPFSARVFWVDTLAADVSIPFLFSLYYFISLLHFPYRHVEYTYTIVLTAVLTKESSGI
jgi:hypothetical protein